MHVLVQRDDLGEAEDGSTPKVRWLNAEDGVTVGDFLRRVHAARLLPLVTGGQATRIAEGDRSLAVVAQEHRGPWLLVGPNVRLVEVAGRLPLPHVRLHYVGQRSPEDVFREHGGDPVRLGRGAFEASAEITWSEAFRMFFTHRR